MCYSWDNFLEKRNVPSPYIHESYHETRDNFLNQEDVRLTTDDIDPDWDLWLDLYE